jgi:hypothetical protein
LLFWCVVFGSHGGLTCFLADRLARDAIFEAMRRRRHFATTGNRAVVEVVCDLKADARLFDRDPALPGQAGTTLTRTLTMGDIAQVSGDVVDLSIDILGSAPIERLDIFDGLDLLETVRPYREIDLGSRVRLVFEGAECRGRARATTWDGSLRIEGNVIERVDFINNWNLDRGITARDQTSLSWRAVTTGNFCAIDLWLRTPLRGSLSFDTVPAKGGVAIADLGLEPFVFGVGGLGRALKVQRLPDVMTNESLTLARRINLRTRGDTRLYVRVQQEDGHRMWSSPMYLSRG